MEWELYCSEMCKRLQNTINTGKECLKCKHCTLDETKKSKIIVKCAARDTEYNFGQIIPCGDMEKNK